MFIQALLIVVTFTFRMAVWGLIAFAAIPLGILVIFLKIFPDFTHEGNFWFWSVFGLSNFVAYYFLRKTILWMVTTITGLCEGVRVTKHF